MRRRTLLAVLILALLLLAALGLFRQPDTRPGMIAILIGRIARQWQP
jgi:hypothetical protein